MHEISSMAAGVFTAEKSISNKLFWGCVFFSSFFAKHGQSVALHWRKKKQIAASGKKELLFAYQFPFYRLNCVDFSSRIRLVFASFYYNVGTCNRHIWKSLNIDSIRVNDVVHDSIRLHYLRIINRNNSILFALHKNQYSYANCHQNCLNNINEIFICSSATFDKNQKFPSINLNWLGRQPQAVLLNASCLFTGKASKIISKKCVRTKGIDVQIVTNGYANTYVFDNKSKYLSIRVRSHLSLSFLVDKGTN